MSSSDDEAAPANAAGTLGFEELGLDLRLLKAVRKVGLTAPTPVQAQCVPLALAGRDVLARAPTGSGKTYAYTLPLLHMLLRRQDSAVSLTAGVGAVILVPTRELCQQVHGVIRQLLGHAGAAGVRVVQLATPSDSASLNPQAPPDAIVATPARLRSHVSGGVSGASQTLELRESVQILVVDEADLLLSYGYGDDIAAIGDALPHAVQTLLLSATITPDLNSIRSLFLHNPATIDLEEEASAQSGGLKQFWLRCSYDDKFLVMCAPPAALTPSPPLPPAPSPRRLSPPPPPSASQLARLPFCLPPPASRRPPPSPASPAQVRALQAQPHPWPLTHLRQLRRPRLPPAPLPGAIWRLRRRAQL